MQSDLKIPLAQAMAPRMDWREVQRVLPGISTPRAKAVVIEAAKLGGGPIQDLGRVWCYQADYFAWEAKAGRIEPPTTDFNVGVVFMAVKVLETLWAGGHLPQIARLEALEKRVAELTDQAAYLEKRLADLASQPNAA